MHRNLFPAIAMLTIAAGCGGPSSHYDATVEGTVTIDGQLANRGQVVFHPASEGPTAYGSIFENGSFSLRVGQGDLSDVDGGNLKSGAYIVTVVVNMPSVADETVGAGGPPKPGARLTAARYASKATSDLRVTVRPGRNVVPLELDGAEAALAELDAADALGSEAASEALNDDGSVTGGESEGAREAGPRTPAPTEESQP